MTMTAIILGVAALLTGGVSLAYAAHLGIVYQRFNDGIKEWAESLDNSTRDAINRQSRLILKELDDRITEQNNQNKYEEDKDNE